MQPTRSNVPAIGKPGEGHAGPWAVKTGAGGGTEKPRAPVCSPSPLSV